ncbi:MAG: DUF3014 domain-containing protein [Vicinamibacteria bacterium]
MGDLDDLDLRAPDEPPRAADPFSEPSPPRAGLWLIGGLLVAGLGAAGYLLLRPRVEAVPSPAPRQDAALSPAAPASPADPRLLDESDEAVRGLLRGLSSHSQFAVWLSVEGLVRRFVAAVGSVAEGESPRASLDFLTPKAGFAVVATRGRVLIDRRSYARYDGIVAVVSSLDAGACARAYRELETLLDAAHAELGAPGGRFSATLDQAIRLLLDTPVPEGEVELRPVKKPHLVYEFVDPRLEGLAPAQKHLLRLGPENARRLKAKLRELADALRVVTP